MTKLSELISKLEKFKASCKPKPSKWHKVEDELPENERDVMVRFININDEEEKIYTGWYCRHSDINQEWLVYGTGVVKYVTHWRELPKPPEKG